MARLEENFTADGNGNSVITAIDDTGLALSANFASGSGTLTVKQKIAKATAFVDYLSSGAAVTLTSSDRIILNTRANDQVRIDLSGSSSPDIDVLVTGNFTTE